MTVSSRQPLQHGVRAQHLEEQVGPAAGRVLLLARDHVAGAHRAALGASALAHAHAAQGGSAQAALVLGEAEVGLWLRGCVAGAQAQVLVQPVGIDHLAGVHLPVRVPDGLELAEGLAPARAEHLGESSARDWPSPCSPESEPP